MEDLAEFGTAVHICLSNQYDTSLQDWKNKYEIYNVFNKRERFNIFTHLI